MEEYYSSEEFKEILAQYKNYINGQEARLLDSDEITDVAEYYHQNDQYEEARQAVELCLHLYPGTTGACCFYARLTMFVDKDIERAKEIAEQIEDKSDIEYTFITAELMIAENKLSKADRYIEENIAEDSDEYDITCVDVAEMFADYRAYKYCKKWLTRSGLTDDNRYKELMGIVTMNEKEFGKSEKIFNELIDEDPYSAQYWNHLATTQFLNNDLSGAADSSGYALAIEPNNVDAIQNMANSMHALGNNEQALKYYTMLSKLKPHDETGELFAGLSLIGMKEYHKAVPHIEKARDIAIENFNLAKRKNYYPEEELSCLHGVLIELIHAYSHCNDHDAANAAIDQYLAHDGNAAIAEILRAYVEMESGHKDQGLAILDRVCRLYSNDVEVLLSAGLTAFDHFCIIKAKEYLSSMVQIAPESWNEGYAYLAYCYYFQNKEKEFRHYLSIACKRNPMEARYVLSSLFPADTDPKDYPDTPTLIP